MEGSLAETELTGTLCRLCKCLLTIFVPEVVPLCNTAILLLNGGKRLLGLFVMQMTGQQVSLGTLLTMLLFALPVSYTHLTLPTILLV